MERKIGEVFEYNGEWYQCLESDGCALCNFKELINCSEILDIRGHCRSDNRSDGKSAIFKKLKKVGGPVIEKGRIFQCLKVHYMSCVECAFNTKSKACYKGTYIDGPCLGGDIWVEIKQNKENMEEKKQQSNRRYTAEKIGKRVYQ